MILLIFTSTHLDIISVISWVLGMRRWQGSFLFSRSKLRVPEG